MSFSSVVQMAVAGGSKIVKPGGEKLDKLEESVSHVSTERRDGEDSWMETCVVQMML